MTDFSPSRLILRVVILCIIAPSNVAEGESPTRSLDDLRGRTPRVEAFERWLSETGFLPPDFEKIPDVPYPQDVLKVIRDGQDARIAPDEWISRRKELQRDVEEWLLGKAPPAPGNVIGQVTARRESNGIETREVTLRFGPDHTAMLELTLLLPKDRQSQRLPVFLVDNLRYTSFSRHALEQGRFITCVYHATDPVYREDKRDPSEAFKDVFGKYDWSEFRRRGWSASRAVDWLLTQDWVDGKNIYIGGHSRSAKQSLAAAAFDERIAGVIASSPGSGGSLHYRYCDQYYYGESCERLTSVFPLWVSPKVRFFSGRENKLPADSHYLYALIAPRPVLMSTAIHDSVENTFAVERMVESVRPVYEMLGKGGNLALRYRKGGHRPDAETEIAHSRFLMLAAEGKDLAEAFAFEPIHRWSYEEWLKENPRRPNLAAMPAGGVSHLLNGEQFEEWRKEGEAVARQRWEASRGTIVALAEKLMGEGPGYTARKVELEVGESDEESKLLNRGNVSRRMRFGGGLNGNLYLPEKKGEEKLPAIIWLAPLHTATGYVPSYRVGPIPHQYFAKNGFAVLCFDPIGTGMRQDERRRFYEENPTWSLMGKMVMDARHAIDAARACPEVDPAQIYLVGFGMGGMTATLAAAVDERVSGAVSVSGWTPFRGDTDDVGTGGMRRYSHLYGWLPNLGTFVGHEQRVAVDFPEILSAIAPRPMLVVAPQYDWHHRVGEVEKAVKAARGAYGLLGREGAIKLSTPDHWVEFNESVQGEVVGWLRGLMK